MYLPGDPSQRRQEVHGSRADAAGVRQHFARGLVSGYRLYQTVQKVAGVGQAAKIGRLATAIHAADRELTLLVGYPYTLVMVEVRELGGTTDQQRIDMYKKLAKQMSHDLTS
jgi:hypothetical protein